MNKVSRLVLIVYAAAFFSSNVFALDDYFKMVNHSHWFIDIKATNNNYCVYWASPYRMTLFPHRHSIWRVAYNAAWFSKCSSHHSSQEFDITFTLGNKKYSTTFEWYKRVLHPGEIRLPKLPDYLDMRVTNVDGYVDDYNDGRVVTFISSKHP